MQEIRQAVRDCLDSGWYVLGENVAYFEREFAQYTGNSHCISVASGTDALEISLKALGVGPGDRVATAANAGFYSSIAILACGAEPVYVDIDRRTYTISPQSLRGAIDAGVRAVIVTHLYGRMADMSSISGLCHAKGVSILEDCAQAHGARVEGRMAGSFGDISCFSFYPTKNLGAMGDGGAICTSDPRLAEKSATLRQYGWSKKYRVDFPGGRNSRLDELQACVLRTKLRYLDRWNEARRAVARRFDEGISNPLIGQKPELPGDAYVAHLYVIEAEGRDALAAWLKLRGVPCDIHYPVPDHRQGVFGGKYAGIELEGTECACGRVLTLPCFPEMTGPEIEQVIGAVNSWGGS